MGISEHAVKEALAGKTPSIYRGPSSFDPISHAREHSRVNRAVARIMETQR